MPGPSIPGVTLGQVKKALVDKTGRRLDSFEVADASDIITASQAASLTQRLSLGVDDGVLLVLGDSTGDGYTRWVYLLTQWLAQQFPAYTVNYWKWNDTAQSYDALGTSNSSKVVQTGTGGKAHAGASTTNGSATVTDPAIRTADQGRPVTGTGIPTNTYVGTVTNGTSFLLSSSPTSQVNVNATATGSTALTLGARILDVYNASVSGQIAGYPIATANRWAAITPKAPQCVIYSYGHNESAMIGDLAYRLHAYPLIRKIKESWPRAGMIGVLQNPRAATDNGSGFAAERENDLSRQRANAELFAAEGMGICDVQRRFLNDPSYATTLLHPDGLHPNDANGSPAWADEMKRHFKASLRAAPAAPPRGETWRFISATQFLVSEGSPTLGATVDNVPTWAFDKDVQAGVVCTTDIPAHWEGYEVYAIWTCQTGSGFTGSNNLVNWDLSWQGLGAIGFSAPIDGVASAGQSTWSAPVSAYGGASNTSSAFQFKATKLDTFSALVGKAAAVNYRPIAFRVRRIAAGVNDTLAETAYLHGLLLVRTA